MPYKDKEKQRAYQAKHHKANHRRYSAKAEARKNELRALVASMKSGKFCECGEGDLRCLDYHHADPYQKLFTVSYAVKSAYSVENILAEIGKCVLVCANCHMVRHYHLRKARLYSPRISGLISWVNQYKESNGCSACGEDRAGCLCFHHCGPKRRSVSQMVCSGYARDIIQKEMDKCTILCANCHRKEHNGNVWLLSSNLK
jgi:hypothetical protein